MWVEPLVCKIGKIVVYRLSHYISQDCLLIHMCVQTPKGFFEKTTYDVEVSTSYFPFVQFFLCAVIPLICFMGYM